MADPARRIINIESIVSYNNKLKQTVVGKNLGVDNNVNPGTKKAGLKLLERNIKNQKASFKPESQSRNGC